MSLRRSTFKVLEGPTAVVPAFSRLSNFLQPIHSYCNKHEISVVHIGDFTKTWNIPCNFIEGEILLCSFWCICCDFRWLGAEIEAEAPTQEATHKHVHAILSLQHHELTTVLLCNYYPIFCCLSTRSLPFSNSVFSGPSTACDVSHSLHVLVGPEANPAKAPPGFNITLQPDRRSSTYTTGHIYTYSRASRTWHNTAMGRIRNTAAGTHKTSNSILPRSQTSLFLGIRHHSKQDTAHRRPRRTHHNMARGSARRA